MFWVHFWFIKTESNLFRVLKKLLKGNRIYDQGFVYERMLD